MKHIIKYNLFESLIHKDVDTDDIKDICLDITDNGKFTAFVNSTTSYKGPRNYIYISLSDPTDYDGFTFGEVKEVLLRLKDFLGIHYGGCSVLISGDTERVDFTIDDEESIDYLDKAYNKIDAPGIGNISIWIV